jgi:hypothetical protein
VSAGVWLVSVSAGVALLAAFLLRRRLAPVAVTLILLVAGAGIGWGGMCLQPDPSVGEFAAAVAALAFLVPAHVRIVLGPFGPQR